MACFQVVRPDVRRTVRRAIAHAGHGVVQSLLTPAEESNDSQGRSEKDRQGKKKRHVTGTPFLLKSFPTLSLCPFDEGRQVPVLLRQARPVNVHHVARFVEHLADVAA